MEYNLNYYSEKSKKTEYNMDYYSKRSKTADGSLTNRGMFNNQFDQNIYNQNFPSSQEV